VELKTDTAVPHLVSRKYAAYDALGAIARG
jgi:hypothetical protein